MPGDSIRISVILPVLNGASTIIRTIDSILAQNYENIELIIIDGGSSDQTLELLKPYRSSISYIESGQDSGITSAFNRGLSRATGELIAILNADDYWAHDTLQTVVAAYRSNPDAGIFYGSVVYVDPANNLLYRKNPCLTKMPIRMHLYHPAVFVTRQAYDAVGAFDESYRYAMDCEWLHRALAAGAKFTKINQVLAFMSLGGASDRGYVRALAEYRQSVVEHKLTSPILAAIYFYWFVSCKTILRSWAFRRILWWKNNARRIDA